MPKVYDFGIEGDYNIMVMEFLGPTTEDLFNFCNRKFTLKTVLLLADQMIARIEMVHSINYIHRDIKPENFLIGLKENSNKIYLIDFGLSKKYRDVNSRQHVPYRENKNLTGTMRYASINNHLGIEQSRRDDLEALGYVFCYFLKGQLPWMGEQVKSKATKCIWIMDKKMMTPVEDLLEEEPRKH